MCVPVEQLGQSLAELRTAVIDDADRLVALDFLEQELRHRVDRVEKLDKRLTSSFAILGLGWIERVIPRNQLMEEPTCDRHYVATGISCSYALRRLASHDRVDDPWWQVAIKYVAPDYEDDEQTFPDEPMAREFAQRHHEGLLRNFLRPAHKALVCEPEQELVRI